MKSVKVHPVILLRRLTRHYGLMGVWYIQAHYPDGFGVAARCNKAAYTSLPNGTVIILNTKAMANTGQQKSSISTLHPTGRGTEGKFSITFPVGPENPPPPYWVLETDYKSYAVAWSCRTLRTSKNSLKHIRYIWLMTRTHNPPENLVRRMSNIAKKFSISLEDIERVDHSNCF